MLTLCLCRAADRLAPGQHVGLVQDGNLELVGPCDRKIGVVDPFLAEEVELGQRFKTHKGTHKAAMWVCQKQSIHSSARSDSGCV